MSTWINEKAAEEAGKMVARRLFEAKGNHSECHLKECEVALIAKLSYELGVRAGIKAVEAVYSRQAEGNWRDDEE